MGFLASGGQKAENRLGEYLTTALKMRNRFNSRKVSELMAGRCIQCELLTHQALEYCHLGHVLSLWETLSVELAKRLTLAGQVCTQ